MYGLRVAPKSWQEHVADVQARRSYKRGRYEACVYFYDRDADPVYSLVNVGDILVVGTISGYEKLRAVHGDNLLVKDTGNVNHDGSKLDLLGRILTRAGDEAQ